MLRNVVRLHTAILIATSVVLLVVPGKVLDAFEIVDPSFSVLSITRVLAGVFGVLAAAVYPLPDLPVSIRGKALMTVALAYGLLGALTIIQQVAIWSNVAGMVLSADCLVFACTFAWLATNERRVFAVSSRGHR